MVLNGRSTMSLTSVGFISKSLLKFIDSTPVQLGTHALFLEWIFILVCLLDF